jgi:RNA polymerase sigma-70 factor (ECF subfamily)
MPTTPQSLLERLKHDPSDQPAWQRFLELYTPFLEMWIRRLLGPSGRPAARREPAEAGDLLQNVLAVVVRRIPEFTHNQQPGAFRKWLKQILLRCVQEYIRVQIKLPRLGGAAMHARLAELEDPASDLSRHFELEHQTEILRRLVLLAQIQFPADKWQMFEATFFKGEAPAVVAARQQVSINEVYLAKSRILKWLRQEGRGLLDEE